MFFEIRRQVGSVVPAIAPVTSACYSINVNDDSFIFMFHLKLRAQTRAGSRVPASGFPDRSATGGASEEDPTKGWVTCMPIDQRVFRDALGHFPTGVTVVTASTPTGPVGMTLQSFMSLSLDPPLVLLAVDRKSTTWPRVAENEKLVINILAEHQGEIARQFARSGTDKFAGVGLQRSVSTQHPVLEDAVAWFDCEIVETHEGGDHVIAVCLVTDFAVPGPEVDLADPLIFHRSRFPTLAPRPTVSAE
jgi:3-hydroxy-9,10-secoandrosta-1,3,5(10)-triene-9,17-dione monooxygenase reductase component